MRICLLTDDEDIARLLSDDGGELVDAPEDAEVLVVDRSHPRIAEAVRRLGQRRRSPPTRLEALMSAAMEAAGDIIEISTPQAQYEYVNPAYERVLGWSLEEAIGKTPGQLIRSDMHDDAYFQKIDETLKAGKAWTGLLISKARDGRLVYLEGTVAAMKDEHGTITHHMAVKRDITARIQADAELRRKQEELEQARDAALEASRAKSQFLANMSHELRTPLNAIIGYSEMLLEDAGDEQTTADLTRIRKAGQHLLTLIDDVLDISKIEAGAMKLHVEAFDVQTAVKSAVATIEPLMVERGNTLTVDFGDGVGEMQADLTKVRQALLNLLANAAKFTEKGEVTLRVTATTEAEEPFIHFEIRDTGIGIEGEHLKRLFRPFVQADASTSRKYGGTGLGLAISQRFCEMMGGRIEVQSTVGEGSVFTIKLPRVVDWPDAVPEPPAAVRPAERRGRQVLVVDDDPTVRDLLTRKLGKQGFQVESAVDGAEGLARARKLKPDAIVLDVMMPELDGWAVLSELKRDPATAEIPVVLVTMLRQSEVGFALGAVDYLVKPVETGPAGQGAAPPLPDRVGSGARGGRRRAEPRVHAPRPAGGGARRHRSRRRQGRNRGDGGLPARPPRPRSDDARPRRLRRRPAHARQPNAAGSPHRDRYRQDADLRRPRHAPRRPRHLRTGRLRPKRAPRRRRRTRRRARRVARPPGSALVDDYGRIDAALDEALELEPEARARFVDGFASDHPDAAESLRALIAAAEEAGPLDDAPHLLTPEDDPVPADRFGPYTLLETLGEGGMGRVYRARRDDGAYEGEVAIKVIRHGLSDRRIEDRFSRERNILARLDHPGIARLRDAGTGPDGAPYLVMDFVRGRTVLEYADAEWLTVDERIDLLIGVCDAVAHAHDHLVVHRDLKPSNILVTEERRPILLDFGIAKVLSSDVAPDEHTRPHERIFTPRWAAPEQLRGDFVGPQADVYALGLLLLNLILGPHARGDGDDPVSAIGSRPVVSVAAATVRATTPRALRRRVRGDLRAIVHRALARATEDRYRSVRAFADDLRAHRRGLPVSARGGRWYRAQRFIVRNLALVALAATAFGLLVAYAVTAGLQRRALEVERDRVAAEAQRAEASAVFLDRMLLQGLAERSVDDEVTVLALLERAEERLDPRSPAYAELLLLTARAYAALGEHESARRTASIARAAAEKTFGPADRRTLEGLRVVARANANLLAFAEARNAAGQLVARAASTHGALSSPTATALLTWAEAVDDNEPALAALAYGAAALGYYTSEGPLSPGLADALVGLGFSVRAPPGLGATIVSVGLAAQRWHLGEMDLRVADTLHKLAMSEVEPADKIATLRSALAIEERVAGPRHVRVANTLNDLGLVLEAVAPDEAIRTLERGLELARALYPPTHPRTVTAVINLGAVLREAGRLQDASTVMAPTFEGLEPNAAARGVLAYHLGLLYQAQNDLERATTLLSVALEEIAGGNYPAERIPVVTRALGELLLRRGDRDGAIAAWTTGIDALVRRGARELADELRRQRDAIE